MRGNGATTRALAPTRETASALQQFSEDQIGVLKATVAKGVSDAELQLFLAVCQRTGLDPFSRQIYAVKYSNQPMFVHLAIDGLRLIAERSGRWEGSIGPYFCGKDGHWTDVWLEEEPPAAAKFAVLKRGFREPIWYVALWKSFFVANSPLWRGKGPEMLGKCAEAGAMRKAFPHETSLVRTAGVDAAVTIDADTGEMLERPALPAPSRRPQIRVEEAARASEVDASYGQATGLKSTNGASAAMKAATERMTLAAGEHGQDRGLLAAIASEALGREVRLQDLTAAERLQVAAWIEGHAAEVADVAAKWRAVGEELGAVAEADPFEGEAAEAPTA